MPYTELEAPAVERQLPTQQHYSGREIMRETYLVVDPTTQEFSLLSGAQFEERREDIGARAMWVIDGTHDELAPAWRYLNTTKYAGRGERLHMASEDIPPFPADPTVLEGIRDRARRQFALEDGGIDSAAA